MTSYNYETFRANFDLVRLKLMLRSWHELCCVNEKLLFLLFQHKTYANQGILMWENCRSIKNINTHYQSIQKKTSNKKIYRKFYKSNMKSRSKNIKTKLKPSFNSWILFWDPETSWCHYFVLFLLHKYCMYTKYKKWRNVGYLTKCQPLIRELHFQ